MERFASFLAAATGVLSVAIAGYICFDLLVLSQDAFKFADLKALILVPAVYAIPVLHTTYIKLSQLETVSFVMMAAVPAGFVFSALSHYWTDSHPNLSKISTSLATVAFSIITGTVLKTVSNRKARP
jgi:hypothetical protein